MKLDARHWLSIAVLAVLVFLPQSAAAGMSPEEVRNFERLRLLAETEITSDQIIVKLAKCYHSGDGVLQDYTKALQWYRKAAQKGNAEAQNNLGNMYYNGDGVVKDYVQAVEWYRKAANQGDAAGQTNLANRYSRGEGVTKDYVQAAAWYRRASDQGLAVAQGFLGLSYDLGEGVAKDSIEAYAYYNIASITDEGAKKCLNDLERRMSRDEVAAGQMRTKELQKEIDAKIAAKKAGK